MEQLTATKPRKLFKNRLSGTYLNIFERLVAERTFIIVMGLAFIGAGFATMNWRASMWFGFAFTAYAAVANDSIQSLGTFIESNKHRKWWVLWMYTGAILIATLTFSYIYFDGDVTYHRLLDDDGNTQYPHPTSFSYFQLIAPLVLIILTRLRMPVSTTFLLLSVFSNNSKGISEVVIKSMGGYGLAFVLSFIVWIGAYRLISKHFSMRRAHSVWMPIQWIISGSLWAVWLMQDGANIAVYLPRTQQLHQFIIFVGTIFLGMGLLFYLRGDKIQGVVSEKKRIDDVRAATLIDFTYVILLIYKLLDSTIPLSTTWVFLGVLGGREIAISLARRKDGFLHKKQALRVIGKDFLYAFIGLIVSLILALGANPSIREEIFGAIGF